MSDDGPDYQHEAAHHEALMSEREEAEAREALAFASAVALIAEYLERHAQIPQRRMTQILFTLADWPENPPDPGIH